jgi:tetratricopeptide (TPR) repeat protein
VPQDLAADQEPDWQQVLPVLLGLALVVATAAVFSRSCANGFVNYDDPIYVTANRHVREGLTGAGLVWALASTEALNWHPLTWISLEADGQLYGLRAWGFHLTSLLLHVANSLLLFLLLHHMTGRPWPSVLAAALFALHPLHVESVAWVAERKDVLSTLFGLLALAAYLRYVRRPGPVRYLAVALALALSLTAKPMLVTLPAVLLLLDFWPLGRLRLGSGPSPGGAGLAPVSLGRALAEKLPLLALAGASAVVTLLAQHQGGAALSLEELPLGARLGNALVSCVRYLVLAVWPADLAVFYPHPGEALPAWQVVGAGCLLTVLTAGALWQARRRPYLLVGWLWYLGTLVPVIGLVQVGEQALADRYTYVPLIGPFVALAWAVADLAEARPRLRPLLAAAAVGVLLACAVGAWRQVGVWRDSRSLWEHALRAAGDNYTARNNLGLAILEVEGDPRQAEEHIRAALRLRPEAPQPYTNLGTALDRQGRADEAIACYRRSLALNPYQVVVRHNLAVLLARQGKMDEAIAQWTEVVRLAPDSADNCYNLARALERQNRIAEAVDYCERSVRLEPQRADYRYTLASLLWQQGQRDAAQAQLREAKRLSGRPPR